MFLLLPWFATIAAMGLQWIVQRLELHGLSRPAAALALGILLTLILGLNLLQAYRVSVSPGRINRSLEALFLRLAQNINKHSADASEAILLVHEASEYYDFPWLGGLTQTYYLPIEVRDLVASPADLPAQQKLLRAPGQIVAVSFHNPDDVRAEYNAFLQQVHLRECVVSDAAGIPVLDVWYPPTMEAPCGELPRGSELRISQDK
jgi:hypothetical protein